MDHTHLQLAEIKTCFRSYLNKLLAEAFYMDDHIEPPNRCQKEINKPTEKDNKFLASWAKPFQ